MSKEMTATHGERSQMTERVELAIGDRVKFAQDRNRWTVRAVTDGYVALTQPQFGETAYTVIDWRRKLRGPCNLIGQAWGDGTYSREQCAAMLEEFENSHRDDPAKMAAISRGERSWHPSWRELAVSHRNNVPVLIERVDKVVAR